MNREEMLEFAQAAVKAAGTPDAVASITEVRNASVRFGQNRITQNLDIFKRELALTVGDGERKSTVRTQRMDKGSLAETASRARALLETASPDPEYMPPVSPGQEYPEIPEAWDAETSQCPSGPRVGAAGKVLDAAVERGYEAAGITTDLVRKAAVCTSTGNRAFHKRTDCSLSFTMDRGLASSYSSLNGTGRGSLNVDEAVDTVASQVALNMNAEDLEPGEYKLILEPEAAWNLVMYLPWLMGAREADRGVSAFSGKEGKRVTGERVTISSSLHGSRPGMPFDDQGLPSRDTVWIENGVLRNLICDRYTAKTTGRQPLFFPETLDMEGGEGSVQDLVFGVDRGILIRRFWYIRFVDMKTLKLTGMTRDGVFLVENGRLSRPLKDFRWNWRPLELFKSIQAIGTPVRKVAGLVPPVVVGPERYPFTD